jgi:hypothetical protein
MALFATVKAKVMLDAVLPFSWGEASSFLEQGSALGSINFRIGGLCAGNLAYSGVVSTSWASCGVTWVGEDVPILVKFPGFVNESL